MKAITYTRYGPPEVLQLSEVEKPVPKADEVLVKIHTSTVNRTDCGFRSAEYFITRLFSGLLKPKNPIPGTEFAGEIEAVGSDSEPFKVGERVFGFSENKFGAHAEYLVVKENDAIATIPEGMSYPQAAPICEGAHYALTNIRAAKIRKGQRVLLNGASGGIGSAAIQLLKAMGVEVTAVCGTENLERIRSLGPDRVIDFKKEDFTELKEKFDVVFDAVGKSSFGKCKPLLKRKGIYMSTELGRGSQNPLLALITPLLGGKKVLFPIPSIDQEDVLFLKERVENGDFSPLIDRIYPMEEAVEAHRYVETGEKVGNVLIDVIGENRSS